MKNYYKHEVIEEGKECAESNKRVCLLAAAIAFAIGIALSIYFYFQAYTFDAYQALAAVGIAIGIVLTLYALTRKNIDFLKEGTNSIGESIKKEVNKRNNSKQGFKYVPQYRSNVLYQLLSDNDSVVYYDENDVDQQPIVKKHKKKKKKRKHGLSMGAILFMDMMDDD